MSWQGRTSFRRQRAGQSHSGPLKYNYFFWGGIIVGWLGFLCEWGCLRSFRKMLNIPTQSFPAPSSQQRVSQSGRNKVNSSANDCIDLFLNPLHVWQLTPLSRDFEQATTNGWNTHVQHGKTNNCDCSEPYSGIMETQKLYWVAQMTRRACAWSCRGINTTFSMFHDCVTYKVALKPGHSLMDWIRFSKSGKDLTGLRGRLIEVTEEELQKHNKRDDCWTCIRGEPGRSVQMSTWCQARWQFTPPWSWMQWNLGAQNTFQKI